MESMIVALSLCLLAVASLNSSHRSFQLNSFTQVYLAANVIFCLVAGRAFHYTSEGMFWILAAGLAWFFGGLVSRMRPEVAVTRATRSADFSPFEPNYRIIVVLSAISAVPYMMLLSTVGFDYSALLSHSTLLAESRYAGEGVPLIMTLLSVPLYLASMCAGIKSPGARGLRNWTILLLPLLVSILAGMSQNVKATVVFCFVLWAAGHLVSMSAQRLRIFSWPRCIMAFSTAYILFELFTFMQAVRYGGHKTGSALAEVMTVYAAGHVSAFTLWFSDIGASGSTGLVGQGTLRGILGVFGVEDLVGSERYQAPVTTYLTTTVLTTFSELIQDFGSYGALFVIAMLSYFTGNLDYRIRSGRVGAVTVGTVVCASIIFSPLTSLLNYTTILLAAILFFLWELSHVLRLRLRFIKLAQRPAVGPIP